jgi:HD-GYP domain-containing protein (c-di-GMP phosphodiesterase class II)
MVRASHERFDGGGYPDGLRGGEIPLEARIVCVFDAIVEAFCAVGATRPQLRAVA